MFNFGYGKSLIAFIPDRLSHTATSFVESLKINSITEESRGARRVVVKRRNLYGERAAALINFYFAAAKIPIRYANQVGDWRRWETHCFQMLNGDSFRAKVTDNRTVTLDKIPGDTLWEHMNRGTLTRRMLKAAGNEYRRAHQFQTRELGCGWSHGDASMTNVVYDTKSKRARLIDFEIRHEKSLPARARHADDLLVFLLDLASRVRTRQWLPFAICFLRAYGNRSVLLELQKRLVVPSGLALIWWNVRTNFTPSAKLSRRFTALRRVLDKLCQSGERLALESSDFHRYVAVDSTRNNRRPSITCQTMRAGTPTSRSRKRAKRDIAKAVSPGMPRRLPITR